MSLEAAAALLSQARDILVISGAPCPRRPPPTKAFRLGHLGGVGPGDVYEEGRDVRARAQEV
jgi:hypothetical protein